jgi:hypothetical protein
VNKTLDERLKDARTSLDKVEHVLLRHAGTGRVSTQVSDQFSELVAFGADIDAWLALLDARTAARRLLTGLEDQADQDDLVPLGQVRVKYEHVRLIGVQAYLATSWALADRLVGMAGRVLCTPQAAFNATQPAQLVTTFLSTDRKKNAAAAFYESIRQTFGWPIAVSYALRNHFVHDGGQFGGIGFFDGTASTSGFVISGPGWRRIEERALSYGVGAEHLRLGAGWPTTPCDDLRALLDVCERETDDALGVLVGSACQTLLFHVGYIHGEI